MRPTGLRGGEAMHVPGFLTVSRNPYRKFPSTDPYAYTRTIVNVQSQHSRYMLTILVLQTFLRYIVVNLDLLVDLQV